MRRVAKRLRSRPAISFAAPLLGPCDPRPVRLRVSGMTKAKLPKQLRLCNVVTLPNKTA
jgi:hypothetical protein